MPSATASGTDAGGASSARSREHKQGNQGRTFTAEQEAAVIRIRRCSPTAFYDILNLEAVKTSCTDSDIKKAYRKQSLLTHPDKNGHQHADEAFKMVSRAFGILGDKEKREKFDRFGGDPDSRFGAAQAQNPFSGFASRQASGGRAGGFPGRAGGMWEEELSPEEMFARFFGGGGGGPFGGPEFVFNFGGGPGIRVHQFGGARPRRRPREAQGQQQEANPLQNLLGLLPILLFFVLPMITSLFSFGDSTPATPQMVFDNPQAPFTHPRTTPNHNVKYFVNPVDISKYSASKLNQLDHTAEVRIVRHLRAECENEIMYKRRLRESAQGWFYQDADRMAAADAYKMPSCERLHSMGVRR
ncbi:putative J domain-containing protein-like protein [Hapsidospora chrysogenum ATCC 11550]|uniref:Putative J domain-containing protein-like protein n=1 Tax=Hapsidospora chrysogenum (strain ATCC 11550 / CBS 779.69 / DSM 880 / IAM 14645 / JCM 23072 / IMI 49137) TaxID=857340 RepID=A0A086TGB9_HAPC1|nr:putative J domain-containing protein-like protein [Hapsidospora chrysogenum ATCC 11550]